MRRLAALLALSVFSIGGIACSGDDNEPECRLNSDCPGDELCISGKCLMECKTNKDCLPDGECKGGYCVIDGESSPIGADGPCGDSPMVGKYLWHYSSCESGMVTAVDSLSCEAQWCPGWEDGSCSSDEYITITVDGTTLSLENEEGVPIEFTLTREFTFDEADPDPGNEGDDYSGRYQFYQCLIEADSQVWVRVGEDGKIGLLDNLWFVTDQPYPGVGIGCSIDDVLNAKAKECCEVEGADC